MQIYRKQGKKNWQEKKLEKALQEYFKKNPEDADRVTIATNEEELKKLHAEFCTEDAQILGEQKNSNSGDIFSNQSTTEDVSDFQDWVNDDVKYSNNSSTSSNPLTDSDPNIRDYVTSGDGFTNERQGAHSGAHNMSFDEPSSYQDAFEIPMDDPKDEKNGQGNNNSNSGSSNSTQSSTKQQKQQAQDPSFNPSFDNMSNSDKKKSTKKLAIQIVEGVSFLLERGIVWYGTKDINEQQLAKYEVSGEMSFDLLVSLPDGQEATVKQFFAMQCENVKAFSKFTEDEKKDISDALYVVLLQKGIAPTPEQELLIAIGMSVGKKVLDVFMISQQNKSVLTQLKQMAQQNRDDYNHDATYRDPQPTYTAPVQDNGGIQDVDFTEFTAPTPSYTATSTSEVSASEMVEDTMEGNGGFAFDPSATLPMG